MGNLLRRRNMLMPAGGRPPADLIDQYVQDGLVLWLDGIKNTRSGHDVSASKWEDLSGNSRDYTYNSKSVKVDTFCTPNGGMTTTKDLSVGDGYTVEIVARVRPHTETQMVASQGGTAKNTVWIAKAGNLVFGAGSAARYATPVCDVNTFNSQGYLNGHSHTYTPSSGSWGYSYKIRLFAYGNNTERPCISDIFAVRIYNRILTADEVSQNFNLDRLRFGSGV